MIVLAGDLLFRGEPILTTGEFGVQVSGPLPNGYGQIRITFAGEIIDHGPRFHVMTGKKNMKLDQTSGQFHLKRNRSAVVRARFAGQHLDVMIK